MVLSAICSFRFGALNGGGNLGDGHLVGPSKKFRNGYALVVSMFVGDDVGAVKCVFLDAGPWRIDERGAERVAVG
jgi:hypothetical protein